MGMKAFTDGQTQLEHIQQLDKACQLLTSRWKQTLVPPRQLAQFGALERMALEFCQSAAKLNEDAITKHGKEIVRSLRWILNKKSCETQDEQRIEHELGALQKALVKLRPTEVITLYPERAIKASIGVLESDEGQAASVRKILESDGFEVKVFNSPEAIKPRLKNHDFDVLVVDLLLPDCPLTSAMAVEEFLADNPIDVPVVMLAEADDLSMRLLALRAGIKAYITKPLEREELLSKINTIIAKRNEAKLRVLVVDDDPILTEYYETVLQTEGFLVQVVTDPLSTLRAVDTFKPDVITLDYLMPGCNGLEIAEILKGDPRTMKTPIIFMSASDEAQHRKGLISLFGHRFLPKPVDIEVLSESLVEAAAKAKKANENLQQISQRTEKNGLANRDFFFSRVEKLLAEACKENPAAPNSYFAMIALDNIPEIQENDGSLALVKVEEAVESFLATHPAIKGDGCRFAEHSFLLHLNDPGHQDSKLFIKSFIDSFNNAKLHQKLSLSIGIARNDGKLPNSMEAILPKLEVACIAAHNAGGNQVKWVSNESANVPVSADITRAIQSRSFELAYQSIVQPEGDEQLFEVSVGLRDKEGNLHRAKDFMPHLDDALEDGHYQLDRWVIEHAVASLESLSGRAKADYSIVIKLSPSLKQAERLLPFI